MKRAIARSVAAGGAAEVIDIVDEAATSIEALGRLRAAGGQYKAVVLEDDLAEGRGEKLVREIRAMHLDLAIVLITADIGLHDRFAADRCTRVVAAPPAIDAVHSALDEIGAHCGTGISPC